MTNKVKISRSRLSAKHPDPTKELVCDARTYIVIQVSSSNGASGTKKKEKEKGIFYSLLYKISAAPSLSGSINIKCVTCDT
jgi:hypothetical protein